MRVLLTTVDLQKSGGVASYYRALRGKHSSAVDFFTIGARTDTEGNLERTVRMITDMTLFTAQLLKRKYDIVHLNPSFDAKAMVRDLLLLLIAKAFGKRVIVYIFGWSPDFQQQVHSWLLPLLRLVLFRADAIIVQASDYRDTLHRWGYQSRVFVETGIVDDSLLDEFVENEIVTKVADPKKDIRLLFLARIERQKGIYEVIEAYQMLKRQFQHIVLVIAGSGSEATTVEAYVTQHRIEDVHLLGHVTGSRRREILRGADVYLLPTFHGEGMPSSVLEAMACGLPVVTRMVGGIRDFFEDGRMGFCPDKSDAVTLSEILRGLIESNESRVTMGKYNHRFAVKHFLPSQVAKRIENIYAELVMASAQRHGTCWKENET